MYEEEFMARAKSKSSGFGLMTNPAIKRVQKAAALESGSTTATYAGVAGKTIYFLLLTVIGVGFYFVINPILMNLDPETVMSFADDNGIFDYTFSLISISAVGIAVIITLVTALLSIFIRAIVPVTGSIYVLAEGYTLAFVTESLAPEYEWMGLTALVLTVVIVLSLLGLYSSGKIRVNQKFRAVVTTMFITVIVGSILMFVLSMIPALSQFSAAVAEITSNPVISIALSIFFIVLACMFLVSDFDAVHQLVENRMPKKYEWSCAFGIAYTVLYLYIKILELLINLADKKDG